MEHIPSIELSTGCKAQNTALISHLACFSDLKDSIQKTLRVQYYAYWNNTIIPASPFQDWIHIPWRGPCHPQANPESSHTVIHEVGKRDAPKQRLYCQFNQLLYNNSQRLYQEECQCPRLCSGYTWCVCQSCQVIWRKRNSIPPSMVQGGDGIHLPAETSSPIWKMPETKKTIQAPRYLSVMLPLNAGGTRKTS